MAIDGVSVKVGVALAVVGLGLGACEQGDVYSSSAAGSGKSAASGTTGCVGSRCGNGAGATSSSGSTGSTGTTSGGVCSEVVAAPDAGCGAGLVELSGAIYNLCATFMSSNDVKIPLPGVAISAFGCSAPAESTDDAGLFDICVPQSTDVSTTFSDSTFVTSNMAEVNLTQGLSYVGANGGIFMLCSTLEGLLETSLPQWQPTEGAVLAVITSISGAGRCHVEADAGLLPDYTGWVIQAQYPDGDAGPWPLVYLTASGEPDFSATYTSSVGFALLYNVVDAGEVRLTATREPGDPYDIGTLCPIQDSTLGFTGNVQIVPGQFGYFPFLVQ